MTDSKIKTGETGKTAVTSRPVASASISLVNDTEIGCKETSYQTMLEVSLSLMSYVSSELGTLMKENPEVAEQVGPMLRVVTEVTSDLDSHRQVVDSH